MSFPQNGFPLAGYETYLVFTNCTYVAHSVGGAWPKCTKLTGCRARPPSVQFVTLRRLVMNDARVGFFPATFSPSAISSAAGQPNSAPRSGSPPLYCGSYFLSSDSHSLSGALE